MTTFATGETQRYFLTYRGVALPLALTEEVDQAGVKNRGTYFRASYDARGRLVRCEKLVYSEVEMLHVYAYDDAGRLIQATVTTPDEDPQVLSFASPSTC